MRRFYSALLYLLTPFVLLKLGYRGLRARDYWRRWPQRFGYYSATLPQPTLWLHAVSVGEFQAALPLIRALQSRYPTMPLLVTATTPTGLQRAQATLGATATCVHAPYDLPGAVRRFLAHARPCVAIIMETEIWPNLYHACAEKRIPLLVVNARLSERSARGYQRVATLTRATLNDVTCIAAQTDEDARRLVRLGANPARVRVLGNIKYDVQIAPDLLTHAAALRAQWGAARPVWIAASTHEGEDEVVLDAFTKIRAVLPQTLLIIVPRHPERFNAVAARCVQFGYRVGRRSEAHSVTDQCDVYVGDTMGELMLLFACSDAAFVGGSLVPVGGHNMLEPAALAVPVATGPHTFNFHEIAQRLLAAGAAQQVSNAVDLARVMLHWLQTPTARYSAGQSGLRWVEANRGAVQRVMDLIGKTMQ